MTNIKTLTVTSEIGEAFPLKSLSGSRIQAAYISCGVNTSIDVLFPFGYLGVITQKLSKAAV